jgi:hypothetical protein
MEVFVKCYKLRATKCNFVEHSSGIISPGSFCKMLQTKGYKMYQIIPEECSTKVHFVALSL